MRNAIAQIDWDNELAGLDVCKAWDTFKSILKAIESKYIPLKHKRSRIHERPAWLTLDIRTGIRTKRAAFKKMKESPIESNKVSYRKSRNEVKRKIRGSKRAKEIDMAKNCNANSNNFFSFYRMNKTSKSIGPLNPRPTGVFL